jgi:hypothetical protein
MEDNNNIKKYYSKPESVGPYLEEKKLFKRMEKQFRGYMIGKTPISDITYCLAKDIAKDPSSRFRLILNKSKKIWVETRCSNNAQTGCTESHQNFDGMLHGVILTSYPTNSPILLKVFKLVNEIGITQEIGVIYHSEKMSSNTYIKNLHDDDHARDLFSEMLEIETEIDPIYPELLSKTRSLGVEHFLNLWVDPFSNPFDEESPTQTKKPSVDLYKVLKQSTNSIFYETPKKVIIHKEIVKKYSKSEKIEVLIKEIKENGPPIALGNIGPDAYNDAPFKLKNKECGHDIYGWKPNTKRSSCSSYVIVLGAKKIEGGGEYVYFTPSKDATTDQKTSIREHGPADSKIYICTHKTFNENLIKLYPKL